MTATAPAGARLTEDGIELPEACSVVVDVLFDDRRVFTVTPPRFSPLRGCRSAPWPVRLRPHLTGRTAVTVREHVSGTVWLATEHAFDDTDRRTTVLDDEGYPLAVDKWGFLVRTFDSSDPRLGAELLADLDALLRLLREDLDIPAFLAYGTLLGAVREGGFLGHDNDADISYVSAFEHPADVAAESFRIERGLLHRGWRVRRSTAGFLQVWRDDAVAEQRKIDVFTGYFRDEVFSIERWVRAPMERSAMLPLGTVTLEGHTFPAPARPEALLEATYGEGWRVPDPGFSFRTPRGTVLRSSGWFGEYWRDQGVWSLHAESTADRGPSDFSAWVGRRLPEQSTVVELGCGVGVDAVALSAAGHRVVALDYSEVALALADERAREAGVEVALGCVTFEDLRATLKASARVVTSSEGTLEVCARNTLNALSARARDHLWRACQVLLGRGGRLFLEYVDPADEAGEAQAPPPPATQVPPLDVVRTEIEARGGTIVGVEQASVDGLRVTRLVAGWAARPERLTATAP